MKNILKYIEIILVYFRNIRKNIKFDAEGFRVLLESLHIY